MKKPIKPLTEIANVNENRLYRIEGGCWNGDFWFELADGETGYIDPEWEAKDESALVKQFTLDYSVA